MPYKDKNTKLERNRAYYHANKCKLNRDRVEARKSKSLSKSQENVQVPVSNPVQVPNLSESDLSRKKLIAELKAKIATVPAVLGKQYVPLKPVRPAYAQKIKSENYSESVQYDYSCV